MVIPGGHTEVKPITPDLQAKAQSIQSLAESKLGEKFEKFEATEYRSQVVAGTVYHFKVLVSDADAVHLKIFEPLPCTKNPMQIMGIQKAKKEDELIPM